MLFKIFFVYNIRRVYGSNCTKQSKLYNCHLLFYFNLDCCSWICFICKSKLTDLIWICSSCMRFFSNRLWSRVGANKSNKSFWVVFRSCISLIFCAKRSQGTAGASGAGAYSIPACTLVRFLELDIALQFVLIVTATVLSLRRTQNSSDVRVLLAANCHTATSSNTGTVLFFSLWPVKL